LGFKTKSKVSSLFSYCVIFYHGNYRSEWWPLYRMTENHHSVSSTSSFRHFSVQHPACCLSNPADEISKLWTFRALLRFIHPKFLALWVYTITRPTSIIKEFAETLIYSLSTLLRIDISAENRMSHRRSSIRYSTHYSL